VRGIGTIVRRLRSGRMMENPTGLGHIAVDKTAPFCSPFPMKNHFIIGKGEGVNYDWALDHVFIKTPAELTGGRVTVVEDTLKPGFHLARHHHKSMVEIFYILEGEVHFKFDDEIVIATPGMTLNVLPNRWHDVSSERGGKLITIFTPGGFDQYLSEAGALSQEDASSEAIQTALAERYDIWMK